MFNFASRLCRFWEIFPLRYTYQKSGMHWWLMRQRIYITEQMVLHVCLLYVDDSLEVHEERLRLYSLESTSADVFVTVIQDILLCMNLAISTCHGQCYNGSKNMCGWWSGVATRITHLESRAPYTHCYGYTLNLAIQDTVKGVKVMEDTLNTVYEITKLIKSLLNMM